MCGICGFVGQGDRQLLQKMTTVIKHRGPDDEGYFWNGICGLGHRRLSIIDVARGHQPIFNEDKSLVIIYNGELYNYQDLRKKLIRRGHKFYTKSDTETILHAYEEYGMDCLDKFNGIFAFAIYNSKNKELFLARDQIGVKPLYYSFINNSLYFASEIKAILENKEIKKEINYKALDYFLTFRYTPEKETLFQNIYKLEPGHYAIFKNSSLKIKKYWDFDFTTKKIKNHKYIKYVKKRPNNSPRTKLFGRQNYF